ncbi:MAG: ISAs1 family transposase [Bacteroidota bacterium]
MSLCSHFSRLTDPRRKEGLRTSLESLLCMATLGYLCGYIGYRGVARFSKAHSELFTQMFDLKHSIPSHVTFSAVFNQLDQQELIAAFNAWVAESNLSPGEWVSADGKTLGSTLVDPHGSGQNYQAVVSFFAQNSGLVHLIDTYQKKGKQEGEIKLVRRLVQQLQGMGLIICLDALHGPKKQLNVS